MSKWALTKVVGGVIGAGVLLVILVLVLTGKVGFMKSLEDRAARERTQRQAEELQRQQNLRRPFEAISFP